MSLNRKGTRRLIGLLAGLGIVTLGGVAQAATVQLNTGVLLVKQSSDGKVNRGSGGGILMPRLEQISGDRLLAIWMDSAPDVTLGPQDQGDNNGYWEGKTAIIQLNKEAAPQISAVQQISQFGGDRPFNHPRLAAVRDASGNPGDYVVVSFAATIEDPNITNEYVMILDSTGKPVNLSTSSTGIDDNGNQRSGQVRDFNGQLVPTVLDVGQRDGDNHGASEMHFVGSDSTGDHFVGGYLHNNNDSYAFGVTITKDSSGNSVAHEDWQTLFVRPANIGRPTIAVTGANQVTACAAKGNNRPPEIGVVCTVLDTTDGHIINKALVAPSQPDQKVYMNQPTIASLGNGLCALGVINSDGQGRNRNGHFQGTNVSMAYTIDCSTLQIKNTQTAVAPFQRHATLTDTLFGNQGQTFVGALGCSSTGAGGAGLQLIGVDQNGMMTVDKVNNLMPVMWSCDTAWLSYKGLRNPRNQGRDFIHTLGSVPNPGFQDPKGWMPEVSHFAISLVPAPVNANSQYPRNSVYASFIPIAWDKSVQVSMGAAVDVSQIPAGPSPTAPNGAPTIGGGTAGGGGGTSGSPSAGSGIRHHGFLGMTDGGGCSIGAVGADPAEGLEGLALVGLGLAIAASRRRR